MTKGKECEFCKKLAITRKDGYFVCSEHYIEIVEEGDMNE